MYSLGAFRFFLLSLVGVLAGQVFADERPVRVMSFNVRFGTANDEDNRWDLRKDLVVKTIAEFEPDVVGTQEMQRFQADYISQKLPQLRYYGLSREPGNPKGEECGIFISDQRFAVLELRHFWLSETPDVPGSKSWDSSLPRMVTMIRLRERRTGLETLVANTHFDHKGKVARVESAKLIRRLLEKRRQGLPVIVCGDFNTPEDSEPYQQLVGSSDALTLVDTLRAFQKPTENDGTFNGFRGLTNGSRIDWVLSSSDYTVLNAAIDRTEEDGRYPSDHYPVTAVLQIKTQK